MSNKKGFTLVEIIVVMMIVGILVAIIIPNFTTYLQQSAAQNALNNFNAIIEAEKVYYFNHGYYCADYTDYNSELGANVPNSPPYNITQLLNINDSNYVYACSAGNDSGHPTNVNCAASTKQCYISSAGEYSTVYLWYTFTMPQTQNKPGCITFSNWCPPSFPSSPVAPSWLQKTITCSGGGDQ